MLLPLNEKWLQQFVSANGRPPKILHIGNIANNAYLNAKFLNMHGFNCDVICYDYYHIMGCPEWEDAKFIGDFTQDHFHPEWVSSNSRDFERPTWFAQGPQLLCLDYLLALQSGNSKSSQKLWKKLGQFNKTRPDRWGDMTLPMLFAKWGNLFTKWRGFLVALRSYHLVMLNSLNPAELLRSKLRLRCRKFGGEQFTILAEPIVLLAAAAARLVQRFKSIDAIPHVTYPTRDLIHQFEMHFPPRKAIFEAALNTYVDALPRWRELVEHYDVVVGYATDGIYPLLAGKHPFVAFEHGTIRNIPFADDVQGQLCALTYRLADAVAITNADNIAAAQKLGLTQHSFIPHPINDLIIDEIDGQEKYLRLHTELDSNFIVFHPSRQHWEPRRHPDWEKGNDFFLRGFAKFFHNINPKASALLVNWGNSVGASKQLIAELGIESRVRWIEPLPHGEMMQMISACDALADQFFLGAFGSTMPKALACGKPALLYLDIETHKWCFPEMPPVVNVQTDQQIFEGLSRLHLDRAYYLDLCAAGKAWYSKWHSSAVVTNSFVDIFRRII